MDPEAVKLVPEDFALKHSVLPIEFEADGCLRITTMMPNDFEVASQLSSITGRQTKFALALSGALEELIQLTYASGPAVQSGEAAERAGARGRRSAVEGVLKC